MAFGRSYSGSVKIRSYKIHALQRDVQFVSRAFALICGFLHSSLWDDFFKAEFPRSMLVLDVAGKAVCKTDPAGSARASALAVVGLCAQLPKTWVWEEGGCPGVCTKMRSHRPGESWVWLPGFSKSERWGFALPSILVHSLIRASLIGMIAFISAEGVIRIQLALCNLYTDDAL